MTTVLNPFSNPYGSDDEEEIVSESVKNAREELLKVMRNNNNIKLKEAQTRNIIFIGRSRSGKSTAIEVFKDLCHVPQVMNIFSETQSASISSFTVEYSDDGNQCNYNINIIDTPGLFEVSKKGSKARGNEILTETIKTCMQYEITKIHLVFFVCNCTAGINVEDLESFAQLKNLFQGAESQMCILITRAENFTLKNKRILFDQLINHEKFLEFVQVVGNRIFFTGAIDPNIYEQYAIDQIKSQIGNVTTMRKSLYDTIFKTNKAVHVTDLIFYQTSEKKVLQLIDEIKSIQKTLGTDDINAGLKEKMQELVQMKAFIKKTTGVNEVAEFIKQTQEKLYNIEEKNKED